MNNRNRPRFAPATVLAVFIGASIGQAQSRNAPIANDYVAVWTSPAPTEETGGPVSMIQLPSGRLIVTFHTVKNFRDLVY